MVNEQSTAQGDNQRASPQPSDRLRAAQPRAQSLLLRLRAPEKAAFSLTLAACFLEVRESVRMRDQPLRCGAGTSELHSDLESQIPLEPAEVAPPCLRLLLEDNTRLLPPPGH